MFLDVCTLPRLVATVSPVIRAGTLDADHRHVARAQPWVEDRHEGRGVASLGEEEEAVQKDERL